jgi:ubiquinol-cytochrome c reductase cytochrome b subunit
MKRLYDWIDSRTGWRQIAHEALYENVPGGARWRYVWGSALTFALAVQFITGIFLWMAYSPSSQTAWESVYYIQDQMLGGWLLRGIHHFMAQAMTVLLLLHLMQVVIDGAYKAPREINFWFGLILLLLVLGLSLTGYLLPWDQKGYWATKVATNLLAVVPVIGPSLQKLVIGGADYGHHTLTRFFALHAGVLPGAIVALLVAHIYLFRRHGIKAKEPLRRPDAAFWPDQVLKDVVACLAVLAVVLILTLRPWLLGSHGPPGAELGAPADGSEPYSAARPEWYFLFLFQFLKLFPGGTEIWGAIVIPSLAILLLFLMPIFGQWRLGHRFNLGLMFCGLLGAGLLTWQALAEDRHNSIYRAAAIQAEYDSERVKILARSPMGIPVAGAAMLLRNDPLTQGPKLFSQKCAGCHRYDGNDGLGLVPNSPQSASDLKGFASREWVAGLLNPDLISSSNYFGGTKFKDGKMSKFVHKQFASGAEAADTVRTIATAISAEAELPYQKQMDAADTIRIQKGRDLVTGDAKCIDCHAFRKPDEEATAPVLTGYGSRDWLVRFIGDPSHRDFYGDRNDRMPGFGKNQSLSPEAIGLIADWLRRDWFEPARAPEGGEKTQDKHGGQASLSSR